jgi:hypothetical protein
MNISNLRFYHYLLIIICILSVYVINTHTALADSYDVTAVVPFDPPTIPATVVSPANNTILNTNSVVITGTCQVLNPTIIISVWNGSTFIGSTVCLVGGTYSLSVGLYNGSNVLVIKSSNINGLYGPDSSPFTVNFNPNLPVPDPAPTQDSGAGGNNNVVSGPANNPQDSGELLLTSLAPFGVTDSENTVSITIRVSGGNNPYTLTIKWGDGTTMTQDLDEEGDYTFNHVYETAGYYNVTALVIDVLGNSRSFSWTVSPSTQSLTTDNQAEIKSPVDETNLKPYIYALVTLTALTLVFMSFIVGRYYQNIKIGNLSSKKSIKKRSKK